MPNFTDLIKFENKVLSPQKNSESKYGFTDETGNWVIPPIYDGAEHFSEGLAQVSCHGKYGFIKPDGSWAIQPIYDDIDGAFSEGLVVFAIPTKHPGTSKVGYLNRDGSIAIAPIFEDANYFNCGRALVKFNGKYGIIDHSGKWIVNPIYDDIDSPYFGDGSVTVHLDNMSGVMDADGHFIVPLNEAKP